MKAARQPPTPGAAPEAPANRAAAQGHSYAGRVGSSGDLAQLAAAESRFAPTWRIAAMQQSAGTANPLNGLARHANAVVQRFTNAEIERRAHELSERGGGDDRTNWLNAKRAAILAEYPDVDVEDVLARSWEIKGRYERGDPIKREVVEGEDIEGESITRDEIKIMARGLSDEELRSATNARRLVLAQRAEGGEFVPKVPAVEEGSRTWANSAINSALNEARLLEPVMTTGHHKVSKSRLMNALQYMSPIQIKTMRETLDLHPQGMATFRSMGSNITLGPNSGMRAAEGGQEVDVARHTDGSAPEMATIYRRVDTIIGEIIEAKVPVPEEQFVLMLRLLERAEKLHYVKTGGELLDRDTSMWIEIPMGHGEESMFKRGSVPPSAPLDVPEGVSVRDLKKSKYRAPAPRQGTEYPYPRLFSGHHHVRRDGLEFRPVTSRTSYASYPDYSTETHAEGWAASGYKTAILPASEPVNPMFPADIERRRIDPSHLIATLQVGFKEMGLAASPLLGTLGDEIDSVEKMPPHLFEGAQEGLVTRFARLKHEAEELANPEAQTFETGYKRVQSVLSIILIFLEGAASEDAGELVSHYDDLVGV